MAQAVLILTAYRFAKKWSEARSTALVVQSALEGRYGFRPEEVFVNNRPEGQPVKRYWAKLRKRLESGNVESIIATPGGEDSLPAFGLSVTSNPGASCIATLKLPYEAENVDAAYVRYILDVAQALIHDTEADYLRGHDYTGWKVLHGERRGHLLFLRGQVDGAYWLTYLCDEYVSRLGGPDKLWAAPAFAKIRLPRGIVLQSHANFLGMEELPRSSELQMLHYYLASLVRPEERP